MTCPSRGLRTVYSEYLQQAYGGGGEDAINNMFSYFVNVAGPLYVWNVSNTKFRRSGHRTNLIRFFLMEPAWAEAILAWLYCSIDSTRSGTYTCRMLEHQNKSIAHIRNSLERSDKIQDYSLFWSIIANMVTNQACGDWASFEINLNGLDRIIDMLGGSEALECQDPHAYHFVEGLRRDLTERNILVQSELAPLKRVSSPPKCEPTSVQPSSLPSGTPCELLALSMAGKISEDVATHFGEAVILLRHYRQGTVSIADHEKQEKCAIESALLDFLNNRTLTVAEYGLCLGLLIKLATTPPFGRIRPCLWSDSEATARVRTFRDMVTASDLEGLKAPVLWTCMAVMEIPLNVSPNFGTRLTLLRDIMVDVSAGSAWSEISSMLARIYLDTELEMLWNKFWEKVLHRSCLTPFG